MRYFVAVAEAGSISKAAQKIYLTQPALSKQIKSLETELGKCLIEREAHSIKLTPAGEVLLNEGRKLLQRSETLIKRVQNADSDTCLRVGYAPSLTAHVLSLAIEQFTARHPRVQIELHDLSSKEILQGLEQGSLDLGVTILPWQETRSLVWKNILETPLVLALANSHPLSKLKSIDASEISGQKLLVYQRHAYPEYWRTLSKWMEAQQIRSSVTGEFDGIHSLLAAVNANLGIAIVAKGSDDMKPQGVALRPIKPSLAPIQVAVGCHLENQSSPILQTFIASLELEAKSHTKSKS